MARLPLRNYFFLFRIRDGKIMSESDLSNTPAVGKIELVSRWEGKITSKLEFPGCTCWYVEYVEEEDGEITIK